MKKVIVVISILLTGIIATAQTPVKIIDFSIAEERKMNSLGEIISDSDSVSIVILFKIDRPQEGAKVYIYFGSEKDKFDIKKIEATLKEEAGQYYILLKNEKNELKGYEAAIHTKIKMEAYQDFSWATLFVVTTDEVQSNYLYYKK